MPEHHDADAAREAPTLTRAYLALSAHHGRTVDASELPAALTGFLTQAQELTRFMEANFELVVGRGYLIHTRGQRRGDWRPGERPLTDLPSAPQTAAAGALIVFLADRGTEDAPPNFSAALAELLARLVELADRLGADFEACLMASYEEPTE